MNQAIANTNINWESEAVLSQIASHIQKPLDEIVRLTRYIQTRTQQKDAETNRVSTIMLESSEQLEMLIKNILEIERQKLIRVEVQGKFKYPELFQFDAGALSKREEFLSGENGQSANRVARADLEWLMELEKTILDHLDASFLSVPWLAEELAVSQRQLFRIVEKYTGLTPNRYIRNLRLHKARTLLRNYAYKTVNEIAQAVGIRDPYYFSRLFKKEFGVMPKELLQ
jgi:AraC-like DNA-binding protein